VCAVHKNLTEESRCSMKMTASNLYACHTEGRSLKPTSISSATLVSLGIVGITCDIFAEGVNGHKCEY
jgi:hypothetical protein